MDQRPLPFTKDFALELAREFPTPFYLYDEAAIRANAQRLNRAFAWAPGFREYFAVKATPNPHILRLLAEEGFGVDCSSLAELLLSERIGITGESIMFTSNNTPANEYRKAIDLGAIVNLDDISHIDYLAQEVGLPDLVCCRYNPGELRDGNAIIGKPTEAKYGFTRDQIREGVERLAELGVSRFGLHTMVVSNELDPQILVENARMLFRLAREIHEQVGVRFEFVNLGGGVGIPYEPDQKPV